MDTSAIEALISAHCSNRDGLRELHEVLAAVAETSGMTPDDEDLERGTQFVCGYIEQVPYMLKVAATAAANVGLQDEMQTILGVARSYWLNDEDLIPDHLGVIGLLDDAYCSLSLLQAVSDHYRLQTGKHLFPDDLSAANRAMRRIIGEPYASDLDRVVTQALSEARVMEAVKGLASPEKQLNFAGNATIWNHGPAGAMPVEALDGLGLAPEAD